MAKYYLEFILNAYNVTQEVIKNSLLEFSERLEVSQIPKDILDKYESFKISMHTDEPTIIFDTCAQLGRIRSVKIDENEEA